MQSLKDWKLALVVAVFVLIDVIILLVYTIIEGLRGNLNAMLVQNEETPSSEVGVRIVCNRCVTTSLIAVSYTN